MNDFKYVEFIRNPQRSKSNKARDALNKLDWIALDYFGYVFINENAENLSNCMDCQNDVPCESYQSIGIFDIQENYGKFSNDSTNFPFLAVLQVTIMPEAYLAKTDPDNMRLDAKKELEALIGNYSTIFDKPFHMTYNVYYTVNNIDFCILIYSDRLDFAEYISHKLKSIVTPGNNYPKYSVYTTISIHKDFYKYLDETKNYMGEDPVFIARVLLNRKFYSKNIIHDFSKLLKSRALNNSKKNKACVITNTHTLPGKYELSIRIENKENILHVLKQTLQFYSAWLTGTEETLTLSNPVPEHEISNSLFFLINHHCIKYLNIRIMFSGAETLCITDENTENICLPHISNKYADLTQLINELEQKFIKLTDHYSKSVLMEYLKKFRKIFYTYGSLSSNDDTRISTQMLQEYLESFLRLLLFHADLLRKNLIDPKNYAMNFLAGINYIQQYTKIIVSVNGISFETPQFGIERDECSIGKLSIAYTEFLREVFEQYYYKRTNKETLREEDDECQFFPKYLPLVVPYMQKGDSAFMMTALLAQNMSDQWNEIKNNWKDHLKEHSKEPMFIICQDMRQYKDVSAFLAASFHELGHYCNRITRKERNSDLIQLYSEGIAKKIVTRWIGSAKTGYLAMLAAELESELITDLMMSVYEALIIYFNKQLGHCLHYPKSIFKEKFKHELQRLVNPYFNINDEISKDTLSDNLYNMARYEFDIEDDFSLFDNDTDANAKNSKLFDNIKEKSIRNLKRLNPNVDENKELLKSEKALMDEIQDLLRLWENLTFIDKKEASENIAEDIENFISRHLNRTNVYAKDWKNQLSNWDLVKQVLNNSIQALTLVLKLCEKSSSDVMIHREMQQRNCKKSSYTLQELKEENIDSKECFIRNVHTIYQTRVQDKFEIITMYSDVYYELYYKMHIVPDDGMISGFDTALNQNLLGLSASDSQLDLSISCYEESLADIVMCVNLDLEDRHYLAVVKNFFNPVYEKDTQWRSMRLVIVLSYLWFVKPRKNEWVKKNSAQKEQDFAEYFSYMKKTLKKNNSDLEIIKLIQDMFHNIINTQFFEITMSRIIKLHPYLDFFTEKDKFEFIRKDLSRKLHEDNEKTEEIQNQEINFILNYYYKNRIKYANTKNTEENGQI